MIIYYPPRAGKHIFTPTFCLHTITAARGLQRFARLFQRFHPLTEIYPLISFSPSVHYGFSDYRCTCHRTTLRGAQNRHKPLICGFQLCGGSPWVPMITLGLVNIIPPQLQPDSTYYPSCERICRAVNTLKQSNLSSFFENRDLISRLRRYLRVI